ncbi:MAG: putative metal-binding motif-containing protein, partial [Myxococcota bacterium]|nr:putative metal-binding motif-containing protein [Myxococcota bacterium]
MKRVETQRSKLQDVCVEVTLAAAGPDDQRLCFEQNSDGVPVAYGCESTETCYNNYCSALATWDTMHVAYSEGAEGGRFPNELPADVKTSFGACSHDSKAVTGKPATVTVTDDPFHGDPAERDMPTGPVWRHDRHLPNGYRVAAGWTTQGWNDLYFHMLPVDAQTGPLCTDDGARVPPGRMTGQIAEMRHSDDLDDDKERSLTDCDDNDPTMHHGHEELCDSKDNDCDGKIDEGLDNFAIQERVAAGLATYVDHDCDGIRGDKTLPKSKRGQVNDLDFDNDGCKNAYEPGNEQNAKIVGDERGICREDCVWDLAASETLTRKDEDWHLNFGDPMTKQAVRRVLASDPAETRLNCVTTNDQPDFNLRLRPREETASFDSECFSLTGDGVGPDGPDTPGWTVLPNNPTEMDLTLERKHICGKLGPPGGEHSMKIYGADGLWALLEVDFDKSDGLEPGKILPRSRPVKLNAAFEQSLDIQVSGRLQPYADNPEDQLLKVSITPNLPKKAQMKVSLDKLKGHVSAEMLKGELSILRDDQFCEDADEEEECEPSKLYWVECTDPYQILQDSGEETATVAMWGGET